MMRLVIDDVVCPIVGREPVLPTYDAKRLQDIDAWREGDDIDLMVASVPTTDELFANGADLYHAEDFNASYHAARLEVDGVALFEGLAVLLGSESDASGRTYRVRLRGRSWRQPRSSATWRSISAP